MKKKQGISLIVLVITIIVMIILAASVVVSLNNTGIIEKANMATSQTNLKQIESLASLAWADAFMDGARTEDELKATVLQSLVENKVDMSKYQVKVTTSGVSVIEKRAELNEYGFYYDQAYVGTVATNPMGITKIALIFKEDGTAYGFGGNEQLGNDLYCFIVYETVGTMKYSNKSIVLDETDESTVAVSDDGLTITGSFEGYDLTATCGFDIMPGIYKGAKYAANVDGIGAVEATLSSNNVFTLMVDGVVKKTVNATLKAGNNLIYDGTSQIGNVSMDGNKIIVYFSDIGEMLLVKGTSISGGNTEEDDDTGNNTPVVTPALTDENGNDMANNTVSVNTEVWDEYGNKIVVPAGFKIKVDSTTNNADSAPEGIVIEDASGNQFVWIPVGKVYKNTAKEYETIALGRYSDYETIPYTPAQAAADYASEIAVGSCYEYVSSTSATGIARNLANFISSATANGGYYLGRYEAGDSSATSRRTSSGTGTIACKANLFPYTWVLPEEASTASKNMYSDGYSTGTFTSDLTNSYAWDTAIIFIQTFGTKSNSAAYHEENEYASTSSTEYKTGQNYISVDSTSVKDEQLNIYDMAGNCREYLTEKYGSSTPVIRGGGYWDNGYSVAWRTNTTSGRSSGFGFRPIIYLAE